MLRRDHRLKLSVKDALPLWMLRLVLVESLVSLDRSCLSGETGWSCLTGETGQVLS